MSEQGGSCWPEQEAVWAWKKRHGIWLEFAIESDLKSAVTAYRIDVQRELTAERAKVAELERKVAAHENSETMIALIKRLESIEAALKLTTAEKEYQRNYANAQHARATAAESQAARLRETIEKAPHDKTCGVNFKGVCRCTCWKSRALQGEPK